ncbi:hypothetical protein [Aneurinibacillus tyrosinisolvens]|uniref:hypothetical protein n=1 Tax=Aneurinibacillus tyrosinisolvens TaxID=1443435 RepID=UPI00063FCF5D|nr:hypothetical protein [Aneurinibacillus tyrosinisolvens]
MIVESVPSRFKRIQLSTILTEAYFREKLPDSDLRNAMAKEKSKLLVVKGPYDDGTYILVKGYRQFCSLQLTKEKDAMCKVTPVISLQKPVVKRLREEHVQKKRNSDEKEAMVAALLPYYTAQAINELTHIPLAIIKKHEKMLAIDPTPRKKRKEGGTNKTGLLLILDIPYINPLLKKRLLDGYLKREIKVYEDKFLTKIVKTRKKEDRY